MSEDSEECKLALKAAAELLKEKCHRPIEEEFLGSGISFEVAEGWNAAEIASKLDRIAKQGTKIEDYRSYVTEGSVWGISIYNKKGGTLFVLKDTRDHSKIDAFFHTVRYGNFRFASAAADGQTITLTKE